MLIYNHRRGENERKGKYNEEKIITIIQETVCRNVKERSDGFTE